LPTPTPEQERQSIVDYLLSQLEDEVVRHAEKIATRRIYGREYEIWDVTTRYKRRWWVITSPTNYYSQAAFESLEIAFTYHLGLETALAHREAPPEEDDEFLRIESAWRRWREGQDELNEIAEAGNFQTVGLHCREALLEMVAVLAREKMASPRGVVPQKGNFEAWADEIANFTTPPGRLRAHVKATAHTAWDAANWLTHSKTADRTDANIVVSAVEHVLGTYVSLVVKKEAPRIIEEGHERQRAAAAAWRRQYEEEHGPIGPLETEEEPPQPTED
jgi:hypothetical protein